MNSVLGERLEHLDNELLNSVLRLRLEDVLEDLHHDALVYPVLGQGLEDLREPLLHDALVNPVQQVNSHSEDLLHEALLNPVQHHHELECEPAGTPTETRHSALPQFRFPSVAQEH